MQTNVFSSDAMLLTDIQRINLQLLATYLISLPEDYEHFDMRNYLNKRKSFATLNVDSAEELGTCGSAACAIGHGPAAGVPITYQDSSWQDYCDRVFIDVPRNLKMWHWCFSDSWENYDNTPRGAAQRIMYMLVYGVPYTYYGGPYKPCWNQPVNYKKYVFWYEPEKIRSYRNA